MSSPSTSVWFKLYDFDTGIPYKGIGATKVEVDSCADLDAFRDAVKKKDKDDGEAAILTRFESSQLRIYKNKDAFDKRNALNKEKVNLNILIAGSAARTRHACSWLRAIRKRSPYCRCPIGYKWCRFKK